MQLCREDDVPVAFLEMTCRSSLVGTVIFTLFIGVLTGVWSYAALNNPVFLVFAVPCLLVVLVQSGTIRAALRPSNWVIRAVADGLYIKFRSYLNHHFPPEDRIVIFLPYAEIDSVNKTREKLEVMASRGTQTQYWTYLDVHLKDLDTDDTAEAIKVEAGRKGPQRGIVSSRANHSPVRVAAPGLLRIPWKSHQDRLRPGIKKALDFLASKVDLGSELRLDRGRLHDLSEQELDALILELAETGQRIEALKLIRHRFGYSLTEAKRFLDELVGGEGGGQAAPDARTAP